MEPKTIDLKPIGYLNPARRPIAPIGQHGLSLITKCNSSLPGPSGVMPTITDEGKHEKANISTTTSGDVRVTLNLLWDSNRLLATQPRERDGLHNGRARSRIAEKSPGIILWQNH